LILILIVRIPKDKPIEHQTAEKVKANSCSRLSTRLAPRDFTRT
jgi:hypothetical protein